MIYSDGFCCQGESSRVGLQVQTKQAAICHPASTPYVTSQFSLLEEEEKGKLLYWFPPLRHKSLGSSEFLKLPSDKCNQLLGRRFSQASWDTSILPILSSSTVPKYSLLSTSTCFGCEEGTRLKWNCLARSLLQHIIAQSDQKSVKSQSVDNLGFGGQTKENEILYNLFALGQAGRFTRINVPFVQYCIHKNGKGEGDRQLPLSAQTTGQGLILVALLHNSCAVPQRCKTWVCALSGEAAGKGWAGWDGWCGSCHFCAPLSGCLGHQLTTAAPACFSEGYEHFGPNVVCKASCTLAVTVLQILIKQLH